MSRISGALLGLLLCGLALPLEAAAPTLNSTSRNALRVLVRQVSLEYRVDPRLVDALVRVESGYKPTAVSRRGAMGLMQLMPSTVSRLGVRNPFDPEQNVRGGVRELERLIDRYAGDLQLALAAYNAGEGAVARYGGVPPYRETRSYVMRIMSLYTGRSYRLPALRSQPEVRLVRDTTGEVVITNYTSAEQRAVDSEQRPGTVLRGGFGQ